MVGGDGEEGPDERRSHATRLQLSKIIVRLFVWWRIRDRRAPDCLKLTSLPKVRKGRFRRE
jgi:hypothetical protein